MFKSTTSISELATSGSGLMFAKAVKLNAKNKIDNTKNDDRDLFESESYKFKKRVKDAYLDLVRSNRLFKVIKVSDDFNITLNRVLNTVI